MVRFNSMPTSNIKRNIPTQTKCLACGDTLIIDPSAPGRLKKYCNDVCRSAFHKGKRPQAENLPSLAELLDTLDELSEGNHSFNREITTIKKILIEYYKSKKWVITPIALSIFFFFTVYQLRVNPRKPRAWNDYSTQHKQPHHGAV